MHDGTIARLQRLRDDIKREREELHCMIFVESHPNLIEGRHEHNRKEIKRYFRLQESGFDTSKAIDKMVKLDGIISDLGTMLWRYENKS